MPCGSDFKHLYTVSIMQSYAVLEAGGPERYAEQCQHNDPACESFEEVAITNCKCPKYEASLRGGLLTFRGYNPRDSHTEFPYSETGIDHAIWGVEAWFEPVQVRLERSNCHYSPMLTSTRLQGT